MNKGYNCRRGISGLSAGIYALQSGFDITILEKQNIPGGNSTSWRRGGYFFEGGMHWLTGSSKENPIYKVWSNLGALDDDVSVQPRSISTYLDNGQNVCLYRDVDKLESICSLYLRLIKRNQNTLQ